MNTHILSNEAQRFITEHLNSDVTKLLLTGTNIKHVTTKELVEQIEAKKKCKHKLPTLFKSQNIYYPNKLHIEQTSSETAANYKSQLVEGERLIDLTAGLGIDSLYFSRTFEEVTHCELNKELSSIAQHNFNQLQIENVSCLAQNGLELLQDSKVRYDCIYLDPSRRHESKGKVFFLSDCEPDVSNLIPDLFEYSDTVLIKTAPLLDLNAGLRELSHVETIHIVAIDNEVKELLWLLKKQTKTANPQIVSVNIKKEGVEHFEFAMDEEQNCKVTLSAPRTYIYEPNAAIMKSGGFKVLAKQLGLFKLHEHTHLYTSEALIDFPGRRFKLLDLIPYQKSAIAKRMPTKANISTRNFPESVAKLRQKFKIKDGGDSYAFFTTNEQNAKIVIVCEKVQ